MPAQPYIMLMIPIRVVILSLFAAVQAGPSSRPSSRPASRSADLTDDPRFHAAIRTAAADYKTWRSVDEHVRLAPTSCKAPLPVRRLSAAAGGGHRRKVYLLYASKQHEGHYVPEQGAAPIGQVLVKEAFAAVECDAGDRRAIAVEGTTHYRQGEPAGLFVMLKLDPRTENTDDGWVYATVETDGTISASGRVDSCMGCHATAPRDRLFGLPKVR